MGHVTDSDGAATPCANRDVLDVRCTAEVAEPADRVVGARDLDRARADVLVRAAHHIDDLARGDAVREQARRIEQYLILALEAAQARHLGHARHGL